jgi:regulator of sirC expression with transglutaminase-like and TPR domain
VSRPSLPTPLPTQPPTALEYFASLVADDHGLPLLEAAASLGLDDSPTLDVQAVLADVDGLAARLKARLPGDAPPVQRLRALNQFFYRDLGFAGNVNDYYARSNSFIHEVLATRRGIPITLALLYMELAQALGLVARGVSFPGHFLVKLRMPAGEVVIDPFNGQSLSREDLDERLLPHRHRAGLVGDFEAPLGLFLQAAPPRDILARMLRNLKEIHRSAEDWPRLLPVQQRLAVLLPQAWDEQRDLGLVLAELGRWPEALPPLQAYLRQRPDAEDAAALRQRVDEMGRQGTPRLH